MTIPVNIKKFFNFFSMDWNLRDNSALLIWKATYYLYPSGAKLFSRNYILTEISRKNLRYLYRGQILARRHWPSFSMPENNKFKEEKRREHIVKTEEKMTAEGTPTASKREAKQTRRTSVYTIGIAHYTYCALLHKFRVLCEAYFGGKTKTKF